MRFYVQIQSSGGNWVDTLGTDNILSAAEQMRYQIREYKETARIVERKDKVLYDDVEKLNRDCS